jgi:hypothetical protein
MMRLKWKLILVCLKIALILTQDRCTVCIEHTIGSKIVLHVLLGEEAQVEASFGPFRDVLVSLQDRCMVCAERTIGLEIILDAPNGIAR